MAHALLVAEGVARDRHRDERRQGDVRRVRGPAHAAHEDDAARDQRDPDDLRGRRAVAGDADGADQDEHRREAAGDRVDEAHLGAPVRGRQEGEIRQLEDTRGGEIGDGLAPDVPGEQRRHGEHRDPDGKRQRERRLGIASSSQQQVPTRVRARRGEGESEGGERHRRVLPGRRRAALGRTRQRAKEFLATVIKRPRFEVPLRARVMVGDKRERRAWSVRGVVVLLLALSAALPSSALAGPSPPLPDPNFLVDVVPRPCAMDTRDKYQMDMASREGWKAPEYDRYPGRVPAPALLVRPDHREARPERRARRAGHDREADAGRLHHPLRARPRARRTARSRRRAGPPAPRHLARREPSATAPARSSPPARRRRSPRSRAATACRSRPPTSGSCSTWSTRRSRSRWSRYITYDVDFIPKAKARRAGHQAGLPGLARRAALAATRCSTSSALRRRDGDVHVAEGAVRGLRPVGQDDRRPGQARQRRRRGPRAAPQAASSFGAIDNFKGGTLIGIGGHLHPGGLQQRDRPRARRPGDAHLHRRGRLLGPRRTRPRPAGPPTSWDFSMKVTGAARLGRPRRSRATSCAATPPTTRRPVDLREHGHRGRAARARRRPTASRPRRASTRSRRPSARRRPTGCDAAG